MQGFLPTDGHPWRRLTCRTTTSPATSQASPTGPRRTVSTFCSIPGTRSALSQPSAARPAPNPVGQTTAGATWARFHSTTARPTLPRPRWGSSKRRTSSRRTCSTSQVGLCPLQRSHLQPGPGGSLRRNDYGDFTGLPVGQAQQTLPYHDFCRHQSPPPIGAAPRRIVTIAENYTVLDNVQWNVGKHSFTFGGTGCLDAVQRRLTPPAEQPPSPWPPPSLRPAESARAPLPSRPARVSPMPASCSAKSTRAASPSISAAGVRCALPRHLTLCPGRLEDDLQADRQPRPALRLLPQRH